MVLDDLRKVIEKLRSRVERHRDYLRNSEFRTRTLLIDPLLRELGWDVENPDFVALEDQPASSKRDSADYILKNSGKNVAIVEAKNIDKKIDDLEYREQADNYARDAGVQFFILTNGVIWLLYKRSLTTSFELLEPIVRFDVVHDAAYHCALASISIWNPNLASGSPKPAMESVIKPSQLVSDSPSSQTSEIKKEQHPQPASTPEPSADLDNSSEQPPDKDPEPEHRKTLILEDKEKHKTYKPKCKSYRACLDKCLKILLEIRRERFEEVLDFRLERQRRPYFSKDPDTLINPRKIGETDIYIYGPFSANRIEKIIEKVAAHFGCEASIE